MVQGRPALGRPLMAGGPVYPDVPHVQHPSPGAAPLPDSVPGYPRSETEGTRGRGHVMTEVEGTLPGYTLYIIIY